MPHCAAVLLHCSRHAHLVDGNGLFSFVRIPGPSHSRLPYPPSGHSTRRGADRRCAGQVQRLLRPEGSTGYGLARASRKPSIARRPRRTGPPCRDRRRGATSADAARPTARPTARPAPRLSGRCERTWADTCSKRWRSLPETSARGQQGRRDRFSWDPSVQARAVKAALRRSSPASRSDLRNRPQAAAR